MGLITNFIDSLREKEAKKLARGLYESVADSANSFKAIFPGKSESDYVKLALEERDNWKKISEQTFGYTNVGETKTVEIGGSDAFLAAIKKVAITEIEAASTGLPNKQKWNLVKVGLAEIDKCSQESSPPAPAAPNTGTQ